MKKGQTKTITKILLIFLITFIILMGGGRLIWNAGKSALNIFGLINITEVDYSKLNNEAKASFTSLIKSIKQCKTQNKNNCYCQTSLSGFRNTHEIEINSGEIKLINTVNNNRIIMSKEKIDNLNCYYDGSIKNENPLTIKFDEDFPRIDLQNDVYFNYNVGLYKSGNELCITSNKLDLRKINACK
jgi:hypothetical protein